MAGSNLKDTLYGGVAVVNVPGLQGPAGKDGVVTPDLQTLHDEAVAAASTASTDSAAASAAAERAVEASTDVLANIDVAEQSALAARSSALEAEAQASTAGRYAATVTEHLDVLTTVTDHITTISDLVEHMDDVVTIEPHIDEIHVVGQDLQGLNANTLDLGLVTEVPDTITTVVDGYIKKVAEHIDDCIHPVAQKLDAIETVATNLTPVENVSKVVSVDYASIFNNGL